MKNDDHSVPQDDARPREFEKLSHEKSSSFLMEFVLFLKNNKKWWLLPILIILGFLAFLSFLSTTGAAPFIYPLF